MSDSVWPHELQHTRFFCPTLSPRVCSSLYPFSWWCCLTVSSSASLFSFLPPVFPSIRVFSNESVLRFRWPEYWSFNISPSNEYSGLISFRMDRLDLLAVRGTVKSSPTPQFKSISSLVLSFLYGPILTPIHDYWKLWLFFKSTPRKCYHNVCCTGLLRIEEVNAWLSIGAW